MRKSSSAWNFYLSAQLKHLSCYPSAFLKTLYTGPPICWSVTVSLPWIPFLFMYFLRKRWMMFSRYAIGCRNFEMSSWNKTSQKRFFSKVDRKIVDGVLYICNAVLELYIVPWCQRKREDVNCFFFKPGSDNFLEILIHISEY